AVSFDYESAPAYHIRIRSTDSGSPAQFVEKDFTINVLNMNEAPNTIVLSATSLAENVPIGTLVANLGAIDPDAGQSHTFALVSGAGSNENSAFAISGNSLNTAAGINYEFRQQYRIRLSTTDNGSRALSYEQAFIIQIQNINDAPHVTALASISAIVNQSTPV